MLGEGEDYRINVNIKDNKINVNLIFNNTNSCSKLLYVFIWLKMALE